MYDLSIILLFFINGLKLQNFASNGSHDLTVLSLNVRNIAIITFKGVDSICIIHSIS